MLLKKFMELSIHSRRYRLIGINNNPPKQYDNYTAEFEKIKNYDDGRPSVYQFVNIRYPEAVIAGQPAPPLLRRELPPLIKVSMVGVYNFVLINPGGGRRQTKTILKGIKRRNRSTLKQGG
jgi:hypothetical protein